MASRQVPYRPLVSVPSLSYGDLASENLLIQGDNLDALKSLLPVYAGRVKCVYIDPPFNTKSAFENRGWAVSLDFGHFRRSRSSCQPRPAIAGRGSARRTLGGPRNQPVRRPRAAPARRRGAPREAAQAVAANCASTLSQSGREITT